MTTGTSVSRVAGSPTAASSPGAAVLVVPSVPVSSSCPSVADTVAARIVPSASRIPMGSGAVYAATDPAESFSSPPSWANTQVAPSIAVSRPVRRSPLVSTSVCWAAALAATPMRRSSVMTDERMCEPSTCGGQIRSPRSIAVKRPSRDNSTPPRHRAGVGTWAGLPEILWIWRERGC